MCPSVCPAYFVLRNIRSEILSEIFCLCVKNLTDISDNALSQLRVYEWYKRLQDTRKDDEVDARNGRSSASTTDENFKKDYLE